MISIGEDAMLHLLTETHIFVSLPNDCLCQMTGEPIIYTVPMKNHSSADTRGDLSIRRGVQEKRPFPIPIESAQACSAKRRKLDSPREKQTLGTTDNPCG